MDQPRQDLPELLTVAEVAEALRVSVVTAYRDVRQGAIPSVRVGGKIRVPREAFLALLKPKAS